MNQRLRVSLSCAVLLAFLTVVRALSQTPQQSAAGQSAPPTPAASSTPQAAPATPAPSNPAPPIDKNAPEITQKEAPAIFKARVDMVTVPVVVRDSRGRIMGNLTKENFQVFDRGKPQEIVRFALEKAGEQAAKAAKTVDTLPTEDGAAKTPDVPERFVAYLFDDMHLPFADLARARDAVGRHLSALPRTDRAAIYTTSGQNNVDFTDDVEKLQADLLLLRPRPISGGAAAVNPCPDVSYYMADLMNNKNDPTATNVAAQEVLLCMGGGAQGMTLAQAAQYAQGVAQQVLAMGEQESHVSLTVFTDVVRHMAAMPGQRIVVLLSPGFFSPDIYQPDKNEIINRAIKANVVINSLDARGLWTDPGLDPSQAGHYSIQFQTAKANYDRLAAQVNSDVLAEMAYGTGGSFFQNNNDLDAGVKQLAAVPEFYYLLAFAPQNLKLDGSFHSLKVSVKANPPVSFAITARKGYYAPKKASNAEETAKEEIEESIFSRDELTDLPVELHTQFFKSNEKDATIGVVCRMDPKHIQFRKTDGRNVNNLTVVSAVFDHNGNFISAVQKVVEIKMKDETMAKLMTTGVITIKTNFSVQPGSYMVRLVVRDSEGQLMSALNGAVAIQ